MINNNFLVQRIGFLSVIFFLLFSIGVSGQAPSRLVSWSANKTANTFTGGGYNSTLISSASSVTRGGNNCWEMSCCSPGFGPTGILAAVSGGSACPNDYLTNTYPTSVDTATMPYMEFTFTVNGTKTIAWDKFVINGVIPETRSKIDVRTSLNNYATSLGYISVQEGYSSNSFWGATDISELNTNYATISGTVKFRIYFYNNTFGNGVIYFNNAANITTQLTNSETTQYSLTTYQVPYSEAVSLWYTEPAPTVTTIPSVVKEGEQVTISGSTFTGATAVKFNGVNATSFTVTNGSSITATVPSGVTAGTISVTGPTGTGISSTSYVVRSLTVSNVPTLLSACVNNTGTITPITISGENLSTSAIILQVNNSTNTGTYNASSSPLEFSTDGVNFLSATSGNQYVINPSAAFASSWSNPNLSSSTIYVRLKSQVSSGTSNFSLLIYGAGANNQFFPIQRVINALPAAPTASNVTYCDGATATALTATASAGHSLQWYTSSTGGTASTTAPTPSTSSASSYFVSQINTTTSCEGPRKEITVSINTPIAITTQPSTSAQTICRNGSVTALTVAVTGSLPTYQWYSNTSATTTGATLISGATSASYTPVSSSSTALYYYCVITGACSTVTSDFSGLITVQPTSVGGTASASATTICSGSTTTVSLSGNTGTIQWQSSDNNSTWSDISGETSSSYTTPALTALKYYRASVKSGLCTAANSNTVTININNAPTITTQPSTTAQNVCLSYPITDLSVVATGAGLTYQWYSNTTASTTGATMITTMGTYASYPVDRYTPSALYYYCVVTGTCGTTTSDFSGLITISPTTVAGTVSGSSTTVCSGGTTTLTLTGHTGTIQWQSSADDLTWSNISGATNATYTTPALTTSTYYRAVVKNGGCLAMNTNGLMISVIPRNFSIQYHPYNQPSKFCQGAAATALSFVATGNNVTYQWYSNTTNSITGATLIQGATFASYTPSTAVASALYYYCVATDSCGSYNSNFSGLVTVLSTVGGTVTAAANTICYNTKASLTLTGSVGSFKWEESRDNITWNHSSNSGANYTTTNLTNSNTQNGTIYYRAAVVNYVTVSTTCGTEYSNVVTINVPPPAGNITTQPSSNPVTICQGAAATPLSVTLERQGGQTYQWYSNTTASTTGSTLITGATSASYTPSTATPSALYYYCEVIGGCPNKTSGFSGLITVISSGVAGTAAASATTICSGSTTTLTLTGSTGSIQWQQSANGTTGWANVTGGTGATTASYTTPTLTATTFYKAVVTNGSCTAVDNNNPVNILVNALPTITIATVQNRNSLETAFTIPYTAISFSPISYSVTAGTRALANFTPILDASFSGYSGSLAVPIPLNSTPGTYDFNVRVSSAGGCQSAVYPITLTITPPPPAITVSSNILNTITNCNIPKNINDHSIVSSDIYLDQNDFYYLINGSIWALYKDELTKNYFISTVNPLTTNQISVNDLFSVNATPYLTASNFPNSNQQVEFNQTTGAITLSSQAYQALPNYPTFNVAGSYLTGANVTITPPANFEISTDQTNWVGTTTTPSTSIVLTSSANTVPSTKIYVRTKSGISANSYSGNITFATTGVSPSPTKSVAATVYAPVVISTQPTATKNVCINSSTGNTISVTATGSNLTYQWYSTSDPNLAGTSLGATNGAQTATLTVGTSTVGTTHYYVIITGYCGAIKSSISSVTIDAATVAGTASGTATFCSGTTTNLSLTGYTGSIQWQQSANGSTGWANVSGGTGGTTDNYTTAALSAKTYYRATLTNGACSSVSSTITVTINPLTAITAQPSSTNSIICQNGTVTPLSITATGSNLTYQWYSNSTASTTGATTISGATSASYSPVNSTPSALYYYCIVTGTCGTETSAISGLITVNATSVAGTASGTASICSGTTSSVSLANYTGTIQWQQSANGTTGWVNVTGGTGATTDNYTTPALTVTTYYRATVTNSVCAAANSNVITITLNPVALPTTLTSVTLCQGELASQLNATAASGHTLQWYTVASGGTAATTAPTPSTLLTGISTYYVSQLNNTSNCESSRVEITTTVIALPSAPTATATINYCQGATASPLTASPSSGYQLQWYTQATGGTASLTAPTPLTTTAGTTTYYVSQKGNVSGCEGARSAITVTVIAAPAAPIVNNVSYCKNESPIALVATALSGNTLQWYLVPTGGIAGNSAPIPFTSFEGTTTYYISQKNNTTSCEGARSPLTVTVNALPAVPTVTNVSYCQNETATALTATALTGNTLQWYTVATNGTPTLTAPTPITTTVGTTTYYVSQKNNTTGCEGLRSSILVTITALPSAPTASTTINYCKGETATALTATATSGNVLQWYTTVTGGTASTTAPTPTTTTVGSTIYYLAQKATGSQISTGSLPYSSVSSSGLYSKIGQEFQVTENQTLKSVTVKIYSLYNTNTPLYLKVYSGVGGTLLGTSENTFTLSNYSNLTFTFNSTNISLNSGQTYYFEISDINNSNAPFFFVAKTDTYNYPAGRIYYGGTIDYYAIWFEMIGQSNANLCESVRIPITVNVNELPSAPTVANVSYCQNETATALTATALTGKTLQWYTAATGGAASLNPPTPTTTTLGTTTYYVSQKDDITGCEGDRSAITVTVNALPVAPTATSISFCQNETATALTATALTGHTLQWYTVASGGTSSSTAPTPITTSAGITTYYVSQKNNTTGCEGPRVPIIVTVYATVAAPIATTTINYCQGATAAALTATPSNGYSLQWYTVATGGTASINAPTPTTNAAGQTMYYVSQKATPLEYTTSSWSGTPIYSTKYESSAGQTFQVTTTQKLKSIKITYYTYATPAGMVLKIYDGVGGTLLGTADNTLVNELYTQQTGTFNFNNSNIILNIGQTYYFELTRAGGTVFYPYYVVGSSYSGGDIYWSGTVDTNQDLKFELIGTSLSNNPCESPRTTIAVNVNAIPVISNVQSMTVGGSTLQLSGSGNPDLTTPWASSNPTIATISSTGEVAAVAGGTTTITYRTAEGCFTTQPLRIVDCAQPFANALGFDGTNDFVTLGDNIENFTDITTEAWVFWKGSTNAYSEILTKDWVNSFAITSSNKLHANFGNGSSWDVGLNSTSSIPLNTWTHVAVSRQNGVVKMYINGIQDSSTATMNLMGQNSSLRAIGGKLMGSNPVSDSYFNGTIDEVRFWSSARSQTQIQSTLNTELSGNESGLLAYFDFNEGISGGSNASINTVLNKANSTTNGTLTNFDKTGTNSNFVQSTISNFDITGVNTICANSTAQYTHSIPGGTWSLPNGAEASVSTNGLVTSAGPENTTLTYTYALNGCIKTSTKAIVIEQPVVSGGASVGAGESLTLSATTIAASTNPWISSNSTIATVSNTGVLNGLTIGNINITYTNSVGCSVIQPISVVAGTTQAPLLTSIANNTTGASTVQINYSLPETPLSGSVKLIFTPSAGGTPIEWIMNDATTVNFAYPLVTDPTTLANVVSGSPLAFTTYDITLSYKDAYNNPVASVTNASIRTLDPPSISLAQSTYSGTINTIFTSITTSNVGGSISSFSINPTLPNGLVFNTSTGTITGTPTVALVNTSFTITAINNTGSATASFILFIDADTDGDGVPDLVEGQQNTDPLDATDVLDSDNDGVPDYIELRQNTDPLDSTDVLDTDGDGVPDYIELRQNTDPLDSTDVLDTDGDGVPDFIEVQQGTNPNVSGARDTDGDGVPDYIEIRQGTNPNLATNVLDTDGDGVPDYIEVRQGTNPNVSGARDNDGDGVPDYVEVSQGTNPNLATNVLDTDGDGVPDYIEVRQGTNPNLASNVLDSDGDGVPDYIEIRQGTNPNLASDVLDTDGDGVPDFIEVQQGTNPNVSGARDTDGDGVPDYIEVRQGTNPNLAASVLDTDGDGVPDYIEVRQGTNPNLAASVLDTDGDGVPDYVEVRQGSNPNLASDVIDTDGDGVPDYIEVRQGTNPNLAASVLDTDGDGVPDYVEVRQNTDPSDATDVLDTDGDGVPDYIELRQSTDPSDSTDVLDTDGDGVPDYIESGQNTDPSDVSDVLDTDGDGVPDFIEVQQGTNPNVSGARDTDGDGVPDYIEVRQGTNPNLATSVLDTDGDGVPDFIEVQQGTNPNVSGARDTDGDGVPDYIEVQQGTNPNVSGARDTDGDGVPDYIEVQQGTNPNVSGARDTDGDGVPDYIEVQQGTNPNVSGARDTDGDGVPDYTEVQQGTNPNLASDVLDTDGDGVPDYIEGQQNTNPSDASDVLDTDGDGVPDYVEGQQNTDPSDLTDVLDTDSDGVPDYIESLQGTNPSVGGDVVRDTDGDGVPDFIEVQQGTNPNVSGARDTDGDGVPDYIEVRQGTNPNLATSVLDTDGDGVPDYIEVRQGTNPNLATSVLDTDGDGVPDFIEVQQGTNPNVSGARDTDGDGVPDYIEVRQGTNPNLATSVLDTDGDGVPDYIEVRQGTNPNLATSVLDTDGDGVPDFIEVQQGTNPNVSGARDTDGDGVPDYIEVQQGTNPNVSGARDTDGDGVPDYVEVRQGTNPNLATSVLDTDGDGVPDYIEVLQGTNPNVPGAKDTDGDGVPDYVEVQQGTNPTVPGDARDTDGDGVPDYVEVQQGTNPTVPGDARDTDGDGVPDYVEVQQGTNPNVPGARDTDGDGVPDYVELQQGTNPNTPWDARDTDGDGVPDYVEVQQGTNPTTPGDAKDTDGDGVPNYVEVQQGTNPTTPGDARDTDGDGVPDYVEVQQGTNPTVPGSRDTDGDGVIDSQEAIDGTDPNNACLSKPSSITLPLSRSFLEGDCDGDGLTNGQELGSNPMLPTDVDNNGTSDYLEFNNHELSDDDLEIFNSMTNNGDALNDVFVIRGIENYPDNTLTIYNRWGVEVYNVEGYGQDDKYFRGLSEGRKTISQSAELPKGTYFYILRYVNKQGVEKERSGYLYITK